jgi:hypothetical protein
MPSCALLYLAASHLAPSTTVYCKLYLLSFGSAAVPGPVAVPAIVICMSACLPVWLAVWLSVCLSAASYGGWGVRAQAYSRGDGQKH